MTDSTRLRISDPGDLIALVPYLLGFAPEDSLIAVWMADGHVSLTGRIDLATPPDELAELLRLMRKRVPVDAGVVLVAWTPERKRARRVLRRAAAALPQEVVMDRLLCDGDRWWSLVCQDPHCCPTTGNPVPQEAEAVALAQALGLTSAPSRAEAVAVVAGPGPERVEDLLPLAREAFLAAQELEFDAGADLVEHLVSELVLRREVPDDAAALELAALACVLDSNALRVAMLVDHADAEAHACVWERVVAVAPPGLAPGAVALLGIASWLAGHGAITTECCRRLELIDPQHPLLPVLAGACIGAWPPSVWDGLRGQVA